MVWTNWKDRRGGKEKIKEADDGEIDDLCGLWYNYGRSSVVSGYGWVAASQASRRYGEW